MVSASILYIKIRISNLSLDPVVFSVVLDISHDDCWLTPCGYWKGPNQVTKKFEDLKLSFQGEQPDNEVFALDFPNILSNLHLLFNQQVQNIGDKKATLRAFLSTSKGKTTDVLKFRHAVFEVRLYTHTHIYIYHCSKSYISNQPLTDDDAADSGVDQDADGISFLVF